MRLSIVYFSFVLVACAGARNPAQPANSPTMATVDAACHVAQLDFDQVQKACAIHGHPTRVPDGLRLALVPDKLTVVSGQAIDVTLRMTNETDHKLSVDIPYGCQIFEVGAYQGEERVDFFTECGGICGGGAIRIVLDPKGYTEKTVQFSAQRRVIESKDGKCIEIAPTDLPAGQYLLKMQTPFRETVAGTEKATYQDTFIHAAGSLKVVDSSNK